MSISGNYTNPYGNYSTSSLTGGSSSIDSTAGNSDVKFSNYTPSSASAEQPKSSGGGIGGFFKGIFNGAKNAVKSLFTPKGLLMAGAGLAACIAFPVAAPLVLGGLAVTAGGAKMYSSMKNGDAEGAGEGFFTAGTGALGVWGSGAIGAAKAGSAGSAGGAGADAAEAGSSSGGFLSKLNPLNWFKSKPAAAAEEPPASIPSSPSVPNQNTNGPVTTSRPVAPIEEEVGTPVVNLPPTNSAATTTTDAATTEAGATAAPKPKMFQGARDNFSNTYNYVKTGPENPFIGPLPKGLAQPSESAFGRAGQVLTGKAIGPDGTPILPTKPIWSLPTSTALAGGLPQGQQAG